MDITIEKDIRKVGDEVYVAVRDAVGKVKPVKMKVLMIRIEVSATGTKVAHISEGGERLPENCYENPWDCQKYIDILENHRRASEQELDALAVQIEKERKEDKTNARK